MVSREKDEYIGNASPLARRVLSWFGITSARQDRLDEQNEA